jgi:hypothetical protein
VQQRPIKELHKVHQTRKVRGQQTVISITEKEVLCDSPYSTEAGGVVVESAVALSAALDTKQADIKSILRGLHYYARTYAILIRELKRLYGGAEQTIALAAAELFKGPKISLTTLD